VLARARAGAGPQEDEVALLLRESDVASLLTMPDCLRAVEEAFRRQDAGLVQNHPRRRLRPPAGILHCMEAVDMGLGRMGLKVYTSYRAGTRFLVLLYDSASGELLAILEADRLGQMRTGAATGVAVRHMARADARSLGLIGAGWQAEAQALAVAEVRDLREARVFSRTPGNRARFAERMADRLGCPVIPVDSAVAAAECDIVVTATTSRTPVLEGSWLRQGTTVCAVGSNSLARAEIDRMVVARADRVVVDSIEQARMEAGDLLGPAEGGQFRWEQARELREVVAGRWPGRGTAEEICLFKSCGLALEDVAAASLVYDRAREADAGTPVPFWE